MNTKIWVGMLSAVLFSACVGGEQGAVEPGSPDQFGDTFDQGLSADAGTPDPAMLPSVHWVRNSAEYKASFLQTYRFAAWTLDEKVYTRDAKAGNWAVVMDADETVLNNSQYQKERGTQGFSPDSWNAWVLRKAATALPGATTFMQHVRELGGKVIIVTNRESTQCPATIENLKAVRLPFDVVLCKTDSSDKNIRFAAIQAGTAVPGMAAAEVLLFVGDNIKDFPNMTQDSRTNIFAFNKFAHDYIVLPNPMYGSWETNPKL